MASLGQELKRERELRGISLKEIADSTKISLRFLRALEDDQLDMLPGKFFTKSIIRSYASYLGLEEETVLNKYHEDTLLQQEAEEIEKKKRKPFKLIPKDVKKLLQYIILIVILILIALSFYLFFPKKEQKTSLDITQLPVLKQRQQLTSTFLSSFGQQVLFEDKGITLDLSFLDKTWIQVYADGRLILDGIKSRGQKAAIKASKEIIIHLGNAGGLTYTINHQKGKSFGRRGAVVKNIKITPNNLQQFIVQEKMSEENKKEISER